MRELLPAIDRWRKNDEQMAIATVVETWGSSPCPIGSKLVATLNGGFVGSVSAGCVESAVIDASKAVLESGNPRLLTFGVADEEAWDVGLACGGIIKVFVEPFSALAEVYPSLKKHLVMRRPLAVVSVLEGPSEFLNRKMIVLPDGANEGDLVLPEHTDNIVASARELLAQESGGALKLETNLLLFVDVYPPVPRLIIVGATHLADVLVTMANLAGFDTYVVDPRSAFANRDRFPHATALVNKWPEKALSELKLDSSAYVVVLTHDPKFDDATLQVALKSRARYVGVLGSQRTNQQRIERLRKTGMTEEQQARLRAPIGLRLGGRSPAEIAISILAEITQLRNRTIGKEKL